jgi:hypothetical protein
MITHGWGVHEGSSKILLCSSGASVRDRVGEGSERIHFSSAILPHYARR